jgi:hypothetical protein
MRIRINYNLFCEFLQRRNILGIPTQIDILASVQRTKTRTYYPEGWEWK